MKIILAIPPSPEKKNIIRMIDCSHEAKASYLWQPNDYMIISSLLDPSDGVTLIDGTADGLSEAQYIRQISEAVGDLLVFALSSVCWESDYAYFLKTKALFPSIPVFVLGDIFLEDRYRSFILEQCDGIIFSPYQLELSEMLKVRVSNGTVQLPGVVTRPEQPMFPEGKQIIRVISKPPRHSLFLKKGYRFPFARHYRFSTVTTMWGCPFACTYCSDSNFPPVIRSYHDVLDELNHVAGLSVRELFFADKVFGFSREDTYPLLQAMGERHAFSWSCYFHPQLYNPELLRLMKAAGCHTIIAGVDSANLSSLRQYKRRVEGKKLEELITDANRIGMDVCADFILGLAHEIEPDVLRTIQYALDLPIDFASFNIAAPLPGSDIRKGMIQSGQMAFGREGFDTCGRSGILGNVNISCGRLRELRNLAFRKFYARPSYLLRRLKKTESLEHFLIQLQGMLSMARKV